MAYLREEFRVASGLNVLIALWLLIAPFTIGFTDLTAATWSSVLTGTLMFIAGMFAVIRPLRNSRLLGLNFLFGLWLLVSPFLLGFSHFPAVALSQIGFGILAIGLAFMASIESRRRES